MLQEKTKYSVMWGLRFPVWEYPHHLKSRAIKLWKWKHLLRTFKWWDLHKIFNLVQ